MKPKSVRILIITGSVLIIGALALAGFNVWTDMQASVKSSEILNQLDFGETSVTAVMDAGDNELQETEAGGIWCIGALEIPSLSIQLPVAEDWDEHTSRIAPCRYSGSPGGGDLIIAGHNYRSHFAKLRQISIGADVYFTDLSGSTYAYRAVAVETVDGKDIEGMQSGDWDLTLFTCNFSGQARIAVRCNSD